MGYQVAIDGPAGAGKSTIAKQVAKEKGFIYVDTGALYRALAVYFLDTGTLPDDEAAIHQALQDVEVSIRYEEQAQQVYVNGSNITSRLREEAVGNLASKISPIPAVRKKLLHLQQELGRTHDVVMDGRDIGTTILPDADVKIFLTASVKARANRRFQELSEKGIPCDLDEITRDIEERDERDMNRKEAPLRQAEDAVLIDSSDLTISQVVQKVMDLCAGAP